MPIKNELVENLKFEIDRLMGRESASGILPHCAQTRNFLLSTNTPVSFSFLSARQPHDLHYPKSPLKKAGEIQ